MTRSFSSPARGEPALDPLTQECLDALARGTLTLSSSALMLLSARTIRLSAGEYAARALMQKCQPSELSGDLLTLYFFERASQQSLRSQTEDALVTLQDAFDTLPPGPGRLRGECELLRGRLHITAGLLHDCTFLDAAEQFGSVGDETKRAQTWLVYGFDLLEQERAEEAEEVFKNVLFECSQNQWEIKARALGYLGSVERYRQNDEQSAHYYGEALALLQRHGEAFWRAVFQMDLGLLHLLAGRFDDAKAALDLALPTLRQKNARTFLIGCAARECAALWTREPCDPFVYEGPLQDTSLEGILRIYSATAKVLRGDIDSFSFDLEQSQHAVLAQRIFAKAQQKARTERLQHRIDREGARIKLANGLSIDFTKRPVLAALVKTLSDHHPAEDCLDIDTLFQKIWNESATKNSRRNRVRVALSTLRKLGLRDLIQCEGGAYRFDPEALLSRDFP